jgi:hypothetical protein
MGNGTQARSPDPDPAATLEAPDRPVSIATSRVHAFRRRQREGLLLLPRIEISRSVADDLVEAGLLAEWDTENPQAIAEAILKAVELLPQVHLIMK